MCVYGYLDVDVDVFYVWIMCMDMWMWMCFMCGYVFVDVCVHVCAWMCKCDAGIGKGELIWGKCCYEDRGTCNQQRQTTMRRVLL